jgi:transposase
MERYPKAFKHRVCGAYQKGKRGKGFGALSKRFGVAKSVIETWHEKWDLGGQTPEAFEDNAGGDRRSILTPKEKERHILDYVSLKNSKESLWITLMSTKMWSNKQRKIFQKELSKESEKKRWD